MALQAYHWVAFALFQISRVKKFLLASNMEFSLAQVGVRLRWMIDNNQRLRDRIRYCYAYLPKLENILEK